MSFLDPILDPERPPWMLRAACRGQPLEVFFPPRGHVAREYTARARAICAGCPVRDVCLEWALSWPEARDFGTFGGRSPEERRRIMATDPVERRACVSDFLADQPAHQFHRRPGGASDGGPE